VIAVIALSLTMVTSGLSSTAPGASIAPPRIAPASNPGISELTAARESLHSRGAARPEAGTPPPPGASPPQWSELPTPTAPSPRTGETMAYDASDGYVLLFGGGNPSTTSGWYEIGDTWTFSNGAWSNITSTLTNAPSPRSDGGMVYDPAISSIVLFGGQAGNGGAISLNDTWTYHAGVWTNVTPAVGPSPRVSPAMAWDNSSDEIVLFGGCVDGTCSAVLGDTWTFSSGRWTNVTGATAPPSRGGAGFSYDAQDGYDLLFGGRSATARFNDTWSFSGGTWTNRTAGAAPSLRVYPLEAYDPPIDSVVVYGGEYFGVFYNDTWSYSGGAWTNLTSRLIENPGPLGRGSLTTLPANAGLVEFGGLSTTALSSNATWELLTSPTSALLVVDVSPASCGPLLVGNDSNVSSGTQLRLAPGNYTAAAPPCAGYLFAHWTAQGGVSFPAADIESPVVVLNVSTGGTLTAVYVAAYAVTFYAEPASCGPIEVGSSGPWTSGTRVTLAVGNYSLAALPCTGDLFDHWDLSGGVSILAGTSNDSGTTLSVVGTGSVTAVYVPLQSVEFLVRPAGCGPIAVGSGASEASGGTLALRDGTYLITAPACAGHVFALWTTTGSVSVPPALANVSGAEMTVSGAGTLTAEYATLNSVLFSVAPSSCGLVLLATPSGVEEAGTASLPNGTYLVTAPDCLGYVFDLWAFSGSVSVAAGATFSSSAEVVVTGPGSLTAEFTPLYSIQFTAQPSSCAPLLVGMNNKILEQGVALLANGTYFVEAPPCAGYTFQKWVLAGSLALPPGTANSSTVELEVVGPGIATAVYITSLPASPPPTSSSSTNEYTLTVLGVLVGAVAGAAVVGGLALVFRRPRRPASEEGPPPVSE